MPRLTRAGKALILDTLADLPSAFTRPDGSVEGITVWERPNMAAHAHGVRAGVARSLHLPAKILPMTDTPLSRDAARLLSKLHTIARETL